jgi:coproporphyrinogen III oxidase
MNDSFDSTLAFCKDSSRALTEVYKRILERNKEKVYGEREMEW